MALVPIGVGAIPTRINADASGNGCRGVWIQPEQVAVGFRDTGGQRPGPQLARAGQPPAGDGLHRAAGPVGGDPGKPHVDGRADQRVSSFGAGDLRFQPSPLIISASAGPATAPRPPPTAVPPPPMSTTWPGLASIR